MKTEPKPVVKQRFRKSDCQKEILESIRFGWTMGAMSWLPVSILSTLLGCFIFNGVRENHPLLQVGLAGWFFLPAIFVGIAFLWSVWEYITVSKGRFPVVQRRVIDKKLRYGRGGSTYPVLVFEGSVAAVVKQEIYESTSCGDAFWLVLTWKGAKRPKKLFSVQKYEFSED